MPQASASCTALSPVHLVWAHTAQTNEYENGGHNDNVTMFCPDQLHKSCGRERQHWVDKQPLDHGAVHHVSLTMYSFTDVMPRVLALFVIPTVWHPPFTLCFCICIVRALALLTYPDVLTQLAPGGITRVARSSANCSSWQGPSHKSEHKPDVPCTGVGHATLHRFCGWRCVRWPGPPKH